MNREKYLPIGTVVILKGGEKKLMITGFNPSTNGENGSMTFDYSACYYPEGVLSPSESYLFNHDMIDSICFIGYEDEEEKLFAEVLKTNINDIDKSLVALDSNIINSTSTGVGDNKTELGVPDNKTDVFDRLRV